MLEISKAKIVHENISLQIGLDERVRQQKVTPDWFISDSNADYSSVFDGTYMATWTFIASRSTQATEEKSTITFKLVRGTFAHLPNKINV